MTESRRRWLLVAIGVACFALLIFVEFATEGEHYDLADALGDALQTALIVATAVAVALLAGRMQTERDERLALTRDLELARAEGEAWRRQAQSHVDGLGAAIARQFEQWNFTGAEREVALLMLKGFVHKEIAALRGTTEATVRHQARTIYQKAGVDGRAGFCAYFLEDLLPPDGAGRSAD